MRKTGAGLRRAPPFISGRNREQIEQLLKRAQSFRDKAPGDDGQPGAGKQ